MALDDGARGVSNGFWAMDGRGKPVESIERAAAAASSRRDDIQWHLTQAVASLRQARAAQTAGRRRQLEAAANEHRLIVALATIEERPLAAGPANWPPETALPPS